MGKFLNKPADAVGESLRGLALCHADTLRLNEHPRFVRRSAPVPGKVALISGGGSGYDPLHAGLVGKACWTRPSLERCVPPPRWSRSSRQPRR